MDLTKLIKNLRQRIEDDHYSFQDEYATDNLFKFLDDFISDNQPSDLEKAFFLFLNQFPSNHKQYFVRPREMVLIPDIYDMGSPGIEYEIDFAIYGGSLYSPIKVAIECDGLRSHRQKHNNKDRRKNVNLQANGWIVMRFGSKEIHEELFKFENDQTHICDFLYYIENVIQQKTKLINWHSYVQTEFRSKLTGYKWGTVTCKHCEKSQMGELNHKKHTCRHCGEKFIRDIHPSEKIAYDFNGLFYFDE